jgi:hypothetical protein
MDIRRVDADVEFLNEPGRAEPVPTSAMRLLLPTGFTSRMMGPSAQSGSVRQRFSL